MSTCLVCSEPLTPYGPLRVHPTCEVNVDITATELFTVVADAIIGQPRSQQKRIGPSEIGHPCDRKLGYKMAGTPEVNERGVAWKPFVGTAVHEQMANILAKHEVQRWTDGADYERFKVEESVSVGDINGTEILGSCDLFDVATGVVYDWKFTTRNMIREKYRTHGPGEQYRAQAHLYGRGWQRAGYEVRSVAVIFMTRDGEFHDRHVFHEPYDEQIALDALARLTSIDTALTALGPEFVIPTLPTSADGHCGFCPWNAPSATDLTVSCPGHPVQAAAPAATRNTNPLAAL